MYSEKLEIQNDTLARAFTDKTKLVIISHIFGVVPPMGATVKLAHQHGCLVFEDCAECYTGSRGYLGHPDSDITAFSFGTIKTATALGGCVALFRDATLRDRVRDVYARSPVRPTRQFAARLLKYGA